LKIVALANGLHETPEEEFRPLAILSEGEAPAFDDRRFRESQRSAILSVVSGSIVGRVEYCQKRPRSLGSNSNSINNAGIDNAGSGDA
jgi:hypothetical protein